MNRRLLTDFGDWEQTLSAFQWNVPEHFNIAERCVTSWARENPDRLALIDVNADGEQRRWSYGALEAASNRFANVLRAAGVSRGDRVAIILPQGPEVMIAHFAVYKLGAIALPLFALFGPDALQYRLQDSGAVAAITNADSIEKIVEIKGDLPDLKQVYCIDPSAAAEDFHAALATAPADFEAVQTLADDPACLIYTSGTTGNPKGALHAHRFLIGHLPSVEMFYNFFPHDGDIGWTPADWAWIGALMDLAMPCLYYGVPLVSHRMRKFSAAGAYELIRATGANVLFLPPTALKIMHKEAAPQDIAVRVISSGGETLPGDLIEWAKQAFGADVNEIYGQTECNLVAASCAAAGVGRPGYIGRAVPGHEVAVLGPDGHRVSGGEMGEIAVKSPDPVMMLRYWNKPDETAKKFNGDWLLTGDLGVIEADGYLRFAARNDDLISSAGYRVGPAEIEDCLTGHEDVVMAAVIGVPDAVKGEVVKAFVVLRDGATWDGLERALIERVRKRISPHVAPRWIEQRDSLPMTATGKILRRALRDVD